MSANDRATIWFWLQKVVSGREIKDAKSGDGKAIITFIKQC